MWLPGYVLLAGGRDCHCKDPHLIPSFKPGRDNDFDDKSLDKNVPYYVFFRKIFALSKRQNKLSNDTKLIKIAMLLLKMCKKEGVLFLLFSLYFAQYLKISRPNNKVPFVVMRYIHFIQNYGLVIIGWFRSFWFLPTTDWPKTYLKQYQEIGFYDKNKIYVLIGLLIRLKNGLVCTPPLF